MTRGLAIALVLAACGDHVHHGIDASPADVAVDSAGATTGDPPANAVVLVATSHGNPVMGLTVVFQNADSSLVAARLTNEQGLAWAEMASGGFVTAVQHVGEGLDELTTFAAVEPGDALELAADPAGDTQAWPVKLGVPADPGATSYQVYTTCGGPFGADPAQPSDTQLIGCKGIADVVVIALDDQNAPLHALYAPDLQVPDAATTYPAFDVPGNYSALVTKSFTYSNVPASVSAVETYHAFAGAHGRVYGQTAAAPTNAGGAVTSLQIPDANPTSLIATSLYGNDVGTQLIFDSRTTAMSPYNLDVAASLLPPYATAPELDPATRTLTWTERTGALQPDLVRTRIHVYRDDIPTGRAWGWRMVAPRTATSVVYPQLPVLDFDFNPASSDTVSISELTTADVPGGYAAVRRKGTGDLAAAIEGVSDLLVVQTLRADEL